MRSQKILLMNMVQKPRRLQIRKIWKPEKRGYKPVIVSEAKKKVILASTYFEDVEEENRKIRESQKPLCERFCDFAERIESKLSEDEIIELYGFLDELSDEEEEKEE